MKNSSIKYGKKLKAEFSKDLKVIEPSLSACAVQFSVNSDFFSRLNRASNNHLHSFIINLMNIFFLNSKQSPWTTFRLGIFIGMIFILLPVLISISK